MGKTSAPNLGETSLPNAEETSLPNAGETSVLHVAGRVRESIVDGPGLRYVIFLQGCPHRCEGCHNPHTWPLEGGQVWSKDAFLSEILRDPLLRGVTFSGGEPFLQAGVLSELGRRIHSVASLDIWTYTGYTWEALLRRTDDGAQRLLRETDVLVDGLYLKALSSYHLRFRGSANQRLIRVKESLSAGAVVLWDSR